MKTFTRFISEESAKEKAHKLGLKYNGFGYWKDNRTGKITHRSKGEDLVPVEHDKAEHEDPRKEEDPTATKGLKPEDSTNIKINTSELGTMVGSPPKPEDDDEWIPGPEGDNCVSDKIKLDDIPVDSFVGKTNDMKWTAGPDGSNYTTDSFDKLTAKVLTPKTDVHKRVMEELTLMLESDEPASKQIRDLRSKNTKPEAGDKTRAARNALKQLNTVDRNRVVDDADKEVNKTIRQVRTARDYDGNTKRNTEGRKKEVVTKYPPNEANKKKRVSAAKDKIPADVAGLEDAKHDEEKTSQLNALTRRMVSDPNFSLGDDNLGDEIGTGDFGSVYDSKDGKYVIKKGKIGVEELRALYAMRDNPHFPTLINAVFDTPFGHKSAKWRSQDPDDSMVDDEFDEKHPHAMGTFAMTKAKGQKLSDVGRMMRFNGDSTLDTAKEKFWKTRAALHRQGYTHNDMHDGNIYVDPDTGEVDIIDMGLSRKSVPAAFFGALAGLDDDPDNDDLGDYQLSSIMKDMPKNMKYIAKENIEALHDYFYQNGWDPGNLRGAIRLSDEEIKERLGEMGISGSGDDVDEIFRDMIDILYDGLDGVSPKQRDMESRMSKAYNQRSKETNTVNTANKIRAKRGVPPIKARKVVPSKNLDPDD